MLDPGSCATGMHNTRRPSRSLSGWHRAWATASLRSPRPIIDDVSRLASYHTPLPSFTVYVERDKSLRSPGPNDVMFSALLSLAFCGQAWGVTSPCLPRFRNFSGLFVLFLYTLDTDVLLLLSRSCEAPDSIDKAQPLPPLLPASPPPPRPNHSTLISRQPQDRYPTCPLLDQVRPR